MGVIMLRISSILMLTILSLNGALAVENPYYIGVKTGWVHGHNACEPHRLKCENDEIGAGVFTGYTLNDWLSLEAGYDYLGKMKAIYPALGAANHTAAYEGRVQGISMAVRPSLALANNLRAFSKLGVIGWRADVDGQEYYFQHHAHDSGLSPLIGIGLEYSLSKQWMGQFEYQWINDVGGSSTGGSSINTLYVGVGYRW